MERVIGGKIAKAVSAAGSVAKRTVERCDPAKAVEVIEELGRGATVRQIAAKYELDRATIERMAKRHRSLIVEIREFISGHAFMDLQRGRGILNRKFDMMEDDPEQIAKTNIRDLAQTVSMLGEGYVASIGENRSTVVVEMGPSVADAMAAIIAAKERAKRKLCSIDV